MQFVINVLKVESKRAIQSNLTMSIMVERFSNPAETSSIFLIKFSFKFVDSFPSKNDVPIIFQIVKDMAKVFHL